MKNSVKWSNSILLGCYTVFVIALFIFISEFLIGVLNPDIQIQSTSKDIILSDRFYISAGLVPNASGMTNGKKITIDNFGSRKTRHQFSKDFPTDIYWGDSVTMGLGVDDDSTFSAILQSKNPEINILNFGLVGYDIDDYINLTTYFSTQKDTLSIRRIILFWCLNDIYDKSIDQLNPSSPFSIAYLDKPVAFLRSHSKIYQFVKAKFTDRPQSYYQFDVRFYSSGSKRYDEVPLPFLLGRAVGDDLADGRRHHRDHLPAELLGQRGCLLVLDIFKN